MTKRLLIVSTLDSNEPFGAFTRPFYLGMYLARHFEVCQLGLNCSAVDYAKSVSVGSRSLRAYVRSIKKCLEEFKPDLIYAQETLPGLAATIALSFNRQKKYPLVFDFHSISSFEYWTRLPSAQNKTKELRQFMKAYLAQGTLVLANKPIIAASQFIVDLIPQWYRLAPKKIYCVSNGVAEDLLDHTSSSLNDPYTQFRPAKIIAVIAPKTFSFPTNDMSVSMTLQIAECLQNQNSDIHFVVIGRDGVNLDRVPNNVTFTGFIPKRSDFIAHLHYADIGLLPFPQDAVAGGARNKALDCLACRQLVISTPEGLRGLEEFRDREHLLITGYSPEEVAETILDASHNLERDQPLAEAAYQLVQEKYSWSAMAQKVVNILNSTRSSSN